jgi:uncharacterized protein (DUF1015 family)
MAILHPFRAVRPDPARAADVACVPYDVIDTREARELANGRPLSFLHVIRPEIDLPEGTDEHADAVYERGGANLRAFVDADYTLREDAPSLYLYRLVMGGRAQTGIFGCVSVDDYDSDVILKHEKTRQSKEDDRTRHILTQGAHAEPVMLTFRDDPAVTAMMDSCAAGEPLYDLTADDGVRHTIWRFGDTRPLVEAFAGIDRLYVADGHHRCKAASRAAAEAEGEEVRYFPAVLFPMGMMHIMPYNRIVRRVPGGVDGLVRTLGERYGLERDVSPVPAAAGRVSVYARGGWLGLDLPASSRPGPTDRLDVGRLTEYVLEPLLGITDPRTDANIDFVGGIRGTAELERLVDSGAAEVAFSMVPTSIGQLVEVSDAGLLMPPKSTWFEPKLRSGLLVHTFRSRTIPPHP